MTHSNSKRTWENRANPLNPTYPVYYRSRGVSAENAHFKAEQYRSILNNHGKRPCDERNSNGGVR